MIHPIVKEPPEAMRHLEVLNYQNGIFGAATVVRLVKKFSFSGGYDHEKVRLGINIILIIGHICLARFI